MTGRSDRIAGAAALVGALAIALEARGFSVDFLTDPLGPKALPLFAAGLLAAGGLLTLLRPEQEPHWPDAGGRTRAVIAGASFLLYAWLLFPLGFFLATALEGAVLARLFGGRIVQCVVAGLAISVLLFALFGWALGLALPVGSLMSGLTC
ncbi:MAG: tripartite tricarboxylate transporter TctB family protein [Gemmatimonadetes bacterium]|nr:tripartite tricarboxylate transporter TctB family protein [Gemmatimonadota bacterium]